MSPLQIIFLLVAACGVAVCVVIYFYQRRQEESVLNINTIPWRIYPKMIRLNMDNTIAFVRSLSDILPIRAWITPFQMILILSDPEDIQKVLSDPKAADKSYNYKFFQNDHGLLSSEHHIWKTHRKIINPAFSINHIRLNMIPVFDEKMKGLVQKMSLLQENSDCDLVHLIKLSLLETSLETFAGEQCEHAEIERYAACMTRRIEIIAERFINIVHHSDALYSLTSNCIEERKCRQFMRGMMKGLMQKHREKWGEEGPCDGKLIIDLLMRRFMDEEITERDVIDELDTMTYTSVDTSTHLIIFTLLAIAMRPEIQEQIVEELQSVFQSPEVPFGYDQLKNLNLLDRVIKETVRLYPIVPFALKVAKEPIQINNGTIPTGALALIPLMTLHESPKLWGPKVKEFNPDNFLQENIKARHPYAFLPFSYGRNCIGMVYAKFVMISVIAKILMNFKVSTTVNSDSDIQTEYKITLNLKNPKPFRLTRRTDFFNNNFL